MKIAIFIGVVAAGIVSLGYLFVLGYQGAKEHTERISREFVKTCESTGGKPVWNYKHWECLK